MHTLGRWLATAVLCFSFVGTANLWTTEDLREFKSNEQDYPHWPLNGYHGDHGDGGSRWDDGDYNEDSFDLGDGLVRVEKRVPEFGSIG